MRSGIASSGHMQNCQRSRLHTVGVMLKTASAPASLLHLIVSNLCTSASCTVRVMLQHSAPQLVLRSS